MLVRVQPGGSRGRDVIVVLGLPWNHVKRASSLYDRSALLDHLRCGSVVNQRRLFLRGNSSLWHNGVLRSLFQQRRVLRGLLWSVLWGLLYELAAGHPVVHAAVHVIVAASSEDKGPILARVNICTTRRR